MKILTVGKDKIGGYHTGDVKTKVTSVDEHTISATHPADSIGTTFFHKRKYNGDRKNPPMPKKGRTIIMTLDEGRPIGWRYPRDKKKK